MASILDASVTNNLSTRTIQILVFKTKCGFKWSTTWSIISCLRRSTTCWWLCSGTVTRWERMFSTWCLSLSSLISKMQHRVSLVHWPRSPQCGSHWRSTRTICFSLKTNSWGSSLRRRPCYKRHQLVPRVRKLVWSIKYPSLKASPGRMFLILWALVR